MNLGRFFSRNAVQTFLVLFAGFLIIQAAGLYIFTMYLDHTRYRIGPHELTRNVLRTVELAKRMKPTELKKKLGLLHQRGLRIYLSRKKPNSVPMLEMYNPNSAASIMKMARDNFYNFHYSMRLANGEYLNIRSRVERHPWFFAGFSASVSVLILLLLFLCWWAVRRLSFPVKRFALASQRFGVDVHAPPMAESGSSEMREVIQAFNQMQGRIRRLINDRTQMLAAISHDLRTPITRLQLRAEYLKGTEQYDKAMADLKEMEQMISSILAFARDYVRTEAMERFDLDALLASICDDLVDTGMAVNYVASDERILVFARLSSLRRALSNLIENAIKYGDEADVSLIRKNDIVQIKITDKGPGVPDDQMEKVFDPFYRVDPARSPQKSGTGLGMAVARDIIRAHGGDIHLSNLKPCGLMVLINLPIKST